MSNNTTESMRIAYKFICSNGMTTKAFFDSQVTKSDLIEYAKKILVKYKNKEYRMEIIDHCGGFVDYVSLNS